jgi:hypothetical protein
VDPLGLATCFYDIATHHLVCYSDEDAKKFFDYQDGFFSGDEGICRDNPQCSENKDEGPTPPGIYEMVKSNKYGGSYWLKENILDRQLCKSGIGRCQFYLHKGHISHGCITANIDKPDTMKQWDYLMNKLENESNNTMIVK